MELPVSVSRRIVDYMGTPIRKSYKLSGGCIGYVWRVELTDGRAIVAKFSATDGSLDTAAEINAADAVADLHRITQTNKGFECDTLICGLRQPNPLIKSWITFFREVRLFHMADKALIKHRLPVTLRHRIDHLEERLDTWISEP